MIQWLAIWNISFHVKSLLHKTALLDFFFSSTLFQKAAVSMLTWLKHVQTHSSKPNMIALCAALHHVFPPPCLEKECPRGQSRGRKEDWNQMNGAWLQHSRQGSISLPKVWLKRGEAVAETRRLTLTAGRTFAWSDTPGKKRKLGRGQR